MKDNIFAFLNIKYTISNLDSSTYIYCFLFDKEFYISVSDKASN